MNIRVGFGYDSHRFDSDPARKLVLAGVDFPGETGLAAFSDGDAVAHAVIDAILGAAALGDVGRHFPPGNPEWADADSMDLLDRSVALLHASGWTVGNVDITVICERPRIGPKASAMQESLASRMGIPSSSVSVKGKSNEGLGWIGAGEGIAVHAVALITSDAQTGSTTGA